MSFDSWISVYQKVYRHTFGRFLRHTQWGVQSLEMDNYKILQICRETRWNKSGSVVKTTTLVAKARRFMVFLWDVYEDQAVQPGPWSWVQKHLTTWVHVWNGVRRCVRCYIRTQHSHVEMQKECLYDQSSEGMNVRESLQSWCSPVSVAYPSVIREHQSMGIWIAHSTHTKMGRKNPFCNKSKWMVCFVPVSESPC